VAQRLKSDWLLVSEPFVAMVAFGLVMVYSASSVAAELNPKINSSFYYAGHQLVWAVVSFIALMYFKRRDYRMLQSPTWAFGSLGVVLFLQILVFFLRQQNASLVPTIEGIGTLQPSEFAKPALILFFAYFVTQKQEAINTRRTMAAAVAGACGAGGLRRIGRPRHGHRAHTAGGDRFLRGRIAAQVCRMAALAAGLLASLGFVAAKPYRMARIVGFFDPEYKVIGLLRSPRARSRNTSESITTRDAGYQVRQSKIAVGSGGVLGLGLMQGRQKILYLPEAHTDFIYAVVGEELGLWGCGALLAGFMVILSARGCSLYWVAHDDFGRYLALGVTSSIVIQALINMSVVFGMGPTKGFRCR
jgi:cell division protein FtsW